MLVAADGVLQKVCAIDIAVAIAIDIPETECPGSERRGGERGGHRLRIDSRHHHH